MKTTRLDNLIAELNRRLVHLKTCLPYADGQQFYRDKDTIRELEDDLSYWLRVQQIVESVLNKRPIIATSAANEGLPSVLKGQAL